MWSCRASTLRSATRSSRCSQEGGIVQKELAIHVSNVALIDPKTDKPTRVGYKMDGERKVRVARRSGEALD